MGTAVVVIGGQVGAPGPFAPAVTDDAYVVAADSGYELAVDIGLPVDLLVGDLDSISPAALDHAVANGVAIDRHDRDKDLTDLGLALDVIDERRPDRLVAFGNAGGRLDHQLAGTAALAAYASARPECAVELHSQLGSTWFLRGPLRAPLPDDTTVSLLPWDDDVVVSVSGVQWPLQSARLRHGSGRGVSNVVRGSHGCSVDVESGLALFIVPVLPSTPKELS